MPKPKEPWQKVQEACERGKGLCWSNVSPPARWMKTVCGLTRPHGATLYVNYPEVSCPVCLKWLKIHGKPW